MGYGKHHQTLENKENTPRTDLADGRNHTQNNVKKNNPNKLQGKQVGVLTDDIGTINVNRKGQLIVFRQGTNYKGENVLKQSQLIQNI